MNNEYLRLYKLWQDNKLTKSEFKLLSSKIESNTPLDKIILWVFNPFSKLSPSYALTIGLCFITLISFIGSTTGFHFEGLPPAEKVLNPKLKFSFIQIFAEHILHLSILSIIFYIIAKFTRAKNIRLFDFFAFITMAYLARAIYSIELYFLKLLSPKFFSNLDTLKILMVHYPKRVIIIWTILQWLMYIWLFRLYFVALELASGLSAKRLWITYILGMIIANTIGHNLSKYLFHWI